MELTIASGKTKWLGNFLRDLTRAELFESALLNWPESVQTSVFLLVLCLSECRKFNNIYTGYDVMFRPVLFCISPVIGVYDKIL